MSNTSNQSDPTGPDSARQQAEDALVDSVLNEALGAETPTNQRDMILRRVEESKTGLATAPTAPKRLIVYAAIAASLIFVSGTFVLPALMKNPQTAINLPDKRAQPKDKNLELDKEPEASAPGENPQNKEQRSSKLESLATLDKAYIDQVNGVPLPRFVDGKASDMQEKKRAKDLMDDSETVKVQVVTDYVVPIQIPIVSPKEKNSNSHKQLKKQQDLSERDQLSQSAQEVNAEESSEKALAPGALTGLINDASSNEGKESSLVKSWSEIRNRYSISDSLLENSFRSGSPIRVSSQPRTDRFGYFIPTELGLNDKSQKEAGYFLKKNKEYPYAPRERLSRSQYAPLQENTFIQPKGEEALSTFSIDVDTASYANTRQYLLQSNHMPPPNAVRIEELVNYFDYDYEGPEIKSEVPFAANMEVASCPWQPKHRLVRIAIKGREVEQAKRPLSNLVFLIDVSGSMNQPNKLPLVVRGLKQLTRRLGENDRVAIVVYASSEGLALDSTPGSERQIILSALDQLAAGGSTAGGAGINLAYKIAEENFIKGGTNRVLLCTDGDFNVGLSNTDALGEMVETKAKESNVFLSVLGFGRGNLNDRMLEKITNQGNGNYSYIDSNAEARKVLVDQMTGTLVTIAKDVKIQVEFNPAKVSSYRLIGYENRVMPNQDFNDDTKDAGEIGAGHTVTAFYEVVPIGVTAPGSVDPLKYQPTEDASTMNVEEPEASATGDEPEGNEFSDELLTLKLRYKQPTEDESSKLEFSLTDEGKSFDKASQEFRFASSVAQFGLLLRNSEYQGRATYQAVAEAAEASLGEDKHNYREEFLDLVDQAKKIE